MTILGFKERFVPPVLAGYADRRGEPFKDHPKRHSIRRGALRHKVGRPIQLYRKVRQKGMCKIVEVDPVCVNTQAIVIERDREKERWWVTVDGQRLADWAMRELATSDGFASVADFFDFFLGVGDGRFEGHIIHWDWTDGAAS